MIGVGRTAVGRRRPGRPLPFPERYACATDCSSSCLPKVGDRSSKREPDQCVGSLLPEQEPAKGVLDGPQCSATNWLASAPPAVRGGPGGGRPEGGPTESRGARVARRPRSRAGGGTAQR